MGASAHHIDNKFKKKDRPQEVAGKASKVTLLICL